MPDVPVAMFLLLLLAALAGGLANALAGGGTFLVFPALLLAGLNPVVANGTSAGAMLPGGVASLWVYRRGSVYEPSFLRALVIASAAGGASGSILLLLTPSERFAGMVPYLMLSATLVFTFSEQIRKWAAPHTSDRIRWIPLLAGHYLISVYGGYFGAGMGVLMIVLFVLTAHMDVQESAALRFYCTLGINGLAVAIFAWRGIVEWKLSLPMAAATVAGGYWGAHAVKRMTTVTARRAVLVYAWVTSIWLFVR